MGVSDSYARRYPRQGLAVNALLLLAGGLLFAGLTLPLLTLEKFYVFSNTVSLWSALQQLWLEREWGLLLLVGAFSVVFPFIKLILLAMIWNLESGSGERHRRHLRWLETYSRWSMLDVFVVALLVVSVKLGVLAEAHVQEGIYFFSGSVILTMLLSNWVGRHAAEG